MSDVLNIQSIRETTLWKHLHEGYLGSNDSQNAEILSIRVESACNAAATRIKNFYHFHSQFTLHDEKHLLRVSELMALILGDDLRHLNPVEVALLLLAAYFHDQGMVPDVKDWDNTLNSSEFKLSYDRWLIEHPNVRDLRTKLDDARCVPPERDVIDLKLQQHSEAHRTDYLRHTHGDRAVQIINTLYAGNDTLEICNVNLCDLLGRLCASHVQPATRLTDDNGFRVDHAVGPYKVNTRFLALVLRLADILDFDRDRTPEPLLKTINFSSSVSLVEWSKHRSVEGWEISPKRIRFTMACEHPAYQKAAYEFMDAIDYELREAHRISGDFPRNTPNYYSFNLPTQVDRERIEPHNNSYRYADLEFTLSRDEIVKLLMTDKLYENNALFVRELLQNGLDALRYRVAIYGQGEPDWSGGTVLLEHFTNADGRQVVRCTDNGVGMDESIVRNFLTNVGRSYYRSPEFAQQRITFRQNGVDFDPCAQFGIGFMSCFMFGDQINITTRRDYGPGRGYGEPLVIQISGLGGLLVIREGAPSQPVGTSVEVFGPRTPAFIDHWEDRVRLCEVIAGYALATEFPITASTLIDEIKNAIQVPTNVAVRTTFLEDVGVKQMTVVQYDFRNVNQLLRGSVRIGLLVDENGDPTIANSEARWDIEVRPPHKKIVLVSGEERHEFSHHRDESATCIDGILICGRPGRDREPQFLGWGSNDLRLGDPFILDIRGDIKPFITPARRPPEHRSREHHTWRTIQSLIETAHARAWEQVIGASRLPPETFWKLALLHDVPVHLMSRRLVWESISIPVINGMNEQIEWIALNRVTQVVPVEMGEERNKRTILTVPDGRRIMFSKEMSLWSSGAIQDYLTMLVLRFARVNLSSGKVEITVSRSDEVDGPDLASLSVFRLMRFYCLNYDESLRDVLTVHNLLLTANRNHPVIRFVLSFDNVEYGSLSDFQLFCHALVWALCDEESLSLSRAIRHEVVGVRPYQRLGVL